MLGGTIKKLRLARGLSQGRVAKDAGISVSFLSLLERGKRDPTLKVLRQLARSLGTPFGLLLASALVAGEHDDTEDRHQLDAIANLVEAVRLRLIAEVVEGKQLPLSLDSPHLS